MASCSLHVSKPPFLTGVPLLPAAPYSEKVISFLLNDQTEKIRLTSFEQEEAVFSKLREWINAEHGYIDLTVDYEDRKSHEKSLKNRAPEFYVRMQEHFTVIIDDDYSRSKSYFLGPKVISSNHAQNGDTQLTYASGIVEELRVCPPNFYFCMRSGAQYHPNGMIRIGDFGREGFASGVEIRDGKTTLCFPILLGLSYNRFTRTIEGKEMWFTEVYISPSQGRLHITPNLADESFQKKWCVVEQEGSGDSKRYSLREDLSLEDLIFMEQRGINFIIDHISSNPSFDRIVRRFFEPENNELLFSLSKGNLMALIRRAMELGIQPNLHRPAEDGRVLITLFQYLSEDELRLICPVDPEVLHHRGSLPCSFFAQSLLHSESPRVGVLKKAFFLLEEMKARGVPFDLLDIWLERVVNSDCSFTDAEFTSLESSVKTKIYRGANILGKVDFVKRLNALGMKNEPVKVDPGSYFGPGMDIATIAERVEALFLKMRQRGDLLTEAEFQQRFPQFTQGSNGFGEHNGNGFVTKRNCFSRVLGAMCFNTRAKGAHFTKAVRKIVVVSQEDLNFDTASIHDITFLINADLVSLTVKAEYMPSSSYLPNYEESMDLVQSLEQTGYVDLQLTHNIRITPKGACIVDNEIRNLLGFGSRQYRILLESFPLHPGAQDYVRAQLEKCTQTRSPEEEQALQEHRSKEQKLREELEYSVGWGCIKNFQVQVNHSSNLWLPDKVVNLLQGPPIAVNIASILQLLPGYRTKPMDITAHLDPGTDLEIRGEGPDMSWEQGILASKTSEHSWSVDMPEGNYEYKIALRHPDGSISWEKRASNRSYRFSEYR
ncbi:MAG: hypothetical protein ACHQUC_02610 [Chlamydiales bacterium]